MTKKDKKGYFYEEQENAVKKYVLSSNMVEKNRIFQEILLPAFTKMIESIIRRYGLHIPNEEFDETFNDTISFLMSKIEHFNPDKISKKTGKKIKAYSYCGTICKRYLLHRRLEYGKDIERNLSYDDINDEINNDIRYSSVENFKQKDFQTELISNSSKIISDIIKNSKEGALSDKEILVGSALVDLLNNWEDILINDGSNKMNKSLVLYHLREMTMLTTKEVRDSMKKYKKEYYKMKNNLIKEY